MTADAQHPETLVLIPGLLCDARLWQGQMRALGAAGRRIVVPDLTRDCHVGAMANRILASVPGRFAVAGFSLGGIVAMELARRAPGRLTRLALLNTTPRRDPPDRKSMRLRQIADAQAGRLRKVVAEELKPRYFCGPAVAELRETVVRMALSQGVDAFRSQSLALMSRADARAWLPSVRVPTLVLAAEGDALCPVAIHREIADAIPGSDLRVIPGCGHMAPMEAPNAVTDALTDWLEAPASMH